VCSGTLQWRVAMPRSRDDWAIIKHLQPGRKYDIQVVTRTDHSDQVVTDHVVTDHVATDKV